MASIYKMKDSGYWWVKWKNPHTGKKERFSTKIPIANGVRGKRQAIQKRNELALKESTEAVEARDHPFSDWVVPYLEATHANVPKTLNRYLGTWKTLNVFLESRGIRHPGQVRRDTCLAYPGWRRKVPHLNSGKKLISPNTVILELKVLGKILFEAFVRGWIPANPCTRLKLQRVPSAVKSEITDAQVATIQAAIERRLQRAKTVQEKERANFLWTSFEVARLQGIRMSETCFRLDEVDFDNGTVLIHGKGNKVATVPLNPALVPLLQSLKAEGKEFTYNMPTRLPGLIWWKFFNELRRKDPSFKRVSFHSTRVSLISRMERAGAPESIVMSLVLHSSTTIHRVYRRVAPKELVPFWAAAGQASDHKSSPPENPDALPATPKPEPAPSGARG